MKISIEDRVHRSCYKNAPSVWEIYWYFRMKVLVFVIIEVDFILARLLKEYLQDDLNIKKRKAVRKPARALRKPARDLPMAIVGRRCSYQTFSFKRIYSESCFEDHNLAIFGAKLMAGRRHSYKDHSLKGINVESCSENHKSIISGAISGADVTVRFLNKTIINGSPGTGSGQGVASSDTVGLPNIHEETAGASSGAVNIHAVEGEGDSESASLHLDSPSPTLSITLVAAQQSDQQPPPGTPPTGTQIEDGTLQEESRLNISGLTKIFMTVSIANGGTIVASRLNANNSLSDNDKLLLASAMSCSAAAFLLCLGGYILDRRDGTKLAALLLTVIGVVAAICGFILMMSTVF